MKVCGATSTWWEGEAEPECILPADHSPPDVHYDDVCGEFDDDDAPVTGGASIFAYDYGAHARGTRRRYEPDRSRPPD